MAGFVYLIHNSTEAPERAAVALEHAATAQRAGRPVDLWLSGEGVRLAVKAVAETLKEPQNAAELIEELVRNGATLYAHRPCFDRRDFDADALRPGAELAGAEVLPQLLDRDRRAITV